MAGESAPTLVPSEGADGANGFDQIMGAQDFAPEFIDEASTPDITQEPFGTQFGAKPPEDPPDTSEATGPKGGGKYDDYKTQNE